MKAMKKCVEEMVEKLSVKYKFDKAEALEYIMPAGETVRGRPTKQKKKVVNKTEMVEDVIKTLMEEDMSNGIRPDHAEYVGNGTTLSDVCDAMLMPKDRENLDEDVLGLTLTEAVAVMKYSETVAAVMEAPVYKAAVVEAAPVKEKKKPAPKKKKAEAEVAVAAVAAVTEPVAAVAEVKADAPVTETVAVVEAAPIKEKKKPAPKKKKAEAEVAVAAVAEPVAAVAEPVAAVAEVKADAPVTETAAVVEAAPVKEKKKAAPKKKKAEAEVAVAAPAVAAPAVTETVAEVKADAPVTEPVAVVEAVAPVKEKKKAAPKKKADAARKVAAGKPEEVVEAPKPVVVEAPKPAPETKAAAPSGGVKGVSPLAVSPLEEDDDEGTAVKEWTHNSRSYLKSCENNCEEDDCNCSGVVYDAETQDQIGTWNGKTLAMIHPTEDDEEADD